VSNYGAFGFGFGIHYTLEPSGLLCDMACCVIYVSASNKGHGVNLWETLLIV
jgi:hypothetical protein